MVACIYTELQRDVGSPQALKGALSTKDTHQPPLPLLQHVTFAEPRDEAIAGKPEENEDGTCWPMWDLVDLVELRQMQDGGRGQQFPLGRNKWWVVR
ncbi:hypothetical protein COCON_G00111030 [Conger conger]|uniref:Uncharacterized protein n=1 Tax=Conger conger TaxID=82655 RepID=A0A9Q1DJM5_CONCO|nr:hypothetical protein COCON_G00111030 [Conger conger]